ncbi:hypothetical protein, partial [Neosynechococcus sphagnicola]|uniref:hypothetical protein n=1 Tax=Neosynechococcus sphagnicola TaxID=1501145 RepID=UPI0005623F1D
MTDEQKAEAAPIVTQSGKPVTLVAKEMDLTESARRRWFKQTHIDPQPDPSFQLTS